jgi:VCBS repeat-containing protein
VVDVDKDESKFIEPETGGLEGTYGDFTFNADTGEWSYSLRNGNANVQALKSGDSVTDKLTVTSLDATQTKDIVVTITGTNDAPTLTVTTSDTLDYANDGTWVDLFSNAAISAVDDGQTIKGLTFTVSGIDGTSDEKVKIDGTDISLAQAGTSGITSASGIGYTVTVSGSTATVVLTSANGLSADCRKQRHEGRPHRHPDRNHRQRFRPQHHCAELVQHGARRDCPRPASRPNQQHPGC